MPSAPRNWTREGTRAWRRSPALLRRDPFQTSDLWDWEVITWCCFKARVNGNLLQQSHTTSDLPTRPRKASPHSVPSTEDTATKHEELAMTGGQTSSDSSGIPPTASGHGKHTRHWERVADVMGESWGRTGRGVLEVTCTTARDDGKETVCAVWREEHSWQSSQQGPA